jgi:hypothetical protein
LGLKFKSCRQLKFSSTKAAAAATDTTFSHTTPGAADFHVGDCDSQKHSTLIQRITNCKHPSIIEGFHPDVPRMDKMGFKGGILEHLYLKVCLS